MSLSFESAERLRLAGFVAYELEAYAEAKAPDGKDQPFVDLGTPLWGRVIESRQSWVEDKIGKGWIQAEIENAIMDYYAKDPERTPFSFLKAEYKSKTKRDYYIEVRARAQRQINTDLKKYY